MRVRASGNDGCVTAEIGDQVVYFSGDVTVSQDAALCAALIPVMAEREVIEVGEVTARLFEGLDVVQDVFRRWRPGLEKVKVVASGEAPPSTAREVGLFFSGGVDSFYSLLKHFDRIDTLIFVHGFDIPLDKVEMRETVSTALREVAADTGKALIEVETDLRTYSDPRANWEIYHGSALAAVAHLLGHRLSEVIIASGRPYDDLFPWGSHPLTDPLWSGRVAITHDGCEASRADKLRAIVGSQLVQDHLRVCYQNVEGAYNCGRCEKCLRTMVTLKALGILPTVRTFPDDVPIRLLRKVPVRTDSEISFARMNLALLETSSDGDAEAAAIRHQLRMIPLRRLRQRVARFAKRYLPPRVADVAARISRVVQ